MIARQLSFAPHRVEVVGVGDAGLWVSGQYGSHWVTPEGVVLEQLDLWLENAFESRGAWYGVEGDPRKHDEGFVCELPQGRALFELSGGH